MIISINVEKLFDKVQCLYKIRPFRKSSYRGKIPQPDKSICKKKNQALILIVFNKIIATANLTLYERLSLSRNNLIVELEYSSYMSK